MYTTEEIQDNYEFKVIKRMLKKEFPFIKDMRLTHNWEEYRSLLFVEIDVDLMELMDYLKMPITKKTTRYMTIGDITPYLSMYFPSSMSGEYDIYGLSKQMQRIVEKVQNSSSIPMDMKLPRNVSISNYKAVGQIVIPQESSPQDNVDK